MNDTRTEVTHWADTQGRSYQVFIDPKHMQLESGDIDIDLPRERWALDLYISRYQAGYLVRVETFAKSIQFILTEAQADKLISLIAPGMNHGASLVPSMADSAGQEAPAAAGNLLWPKVSPLAVWALICSSISFIPVVGWVSALAALILLILHRALVRRSAAMAHSRRMCVAASVFLVVGAVVSVLALWGMREHGAGGLERTSFLSVPPPAREHHWGMIISGILVVLASLSIHECAHAITAWWLGDSLAKSLGRVTLNPVAHIDPIGTVLLPIILAVSKAPIFFGYAKPVPVYVETLPRYRRAHILISVAGPGSNLLLAAASMAVLLGAVCALRLAVPGATVTHLASLSVTTPIEASGFALASYFAIGCTLLKLSFVVNVALAFFNLIPIPPLDGSWVLEHLFPRTLGQLYAVIRPYGFLIFVLALYSNVLDYLRYPVDFVLVAGLGLLAAATGW